jgi:hypothetical protein
VPAKIATPTLTYVDKNVRIDWTAPNNNYNSLLGYKVEIRKADGLTWFEDQVN